jgi:agmatinase
MKKVLKTTTLTTLCDPHYIDTDNCQEIRANTTHLIGFEFDGTACFRKGTVQGPNAIREVSEGIESYSPYLDRETTALSPIVDLGNLPVGKSNDVDANWQKATDAFFSITEGIDLKAHGVRFLTLGGEHSISYAPIATYLKNFPDLVLLHLDAHADLRDGYLGHHFSHASIIRRSLDHFGPGHQLIQYGIRSGTKEEYQWMREHGTQRTSLEDFLESVRAIDPQRPIYLTLDLDYFDPAYVPGTGTPEAGGETFHSFIKLVKILDKKNFVGCDVTELSPALDASGNSDVFATKVVRELLLVLEGQS